VGRDKLTLVASPVIYDQGAPAVCRKDRIFVYQRLTSAPDAAQDRAIDA
jgi:hypothetical protein